MPTRVACSTAVLVATVVLSMRLGAQVLTGQVRDSASARAIAGAVIVGLDAGGRALSRAASNEHGAYQLRLHGGETSLRVSRIGFRPVVRATIPANGKLDIVMTPIATLLEPVVVSGRSHCPRDWSTPGSLGLLDQARAALLNSVAARDENPAKMVRLGFKRDYGNVSSAPGAQPVKDSIHRQWVSIDSAARTAAAYAADVPPATFVSDGFIGLRGSDTAFYAPDVETLLDPSFSAAYCFRIIAPDANATPRPLVGLQFQRPQRVAGRIDVDAVLWIDTAARALDRLEYRYVGLSPVQASVNPGGFLAFHELPSGMVIVHRWAIKLGSPHPNPIPGGPMRLQVQETGGEVAAVELPDGRIIRAALGRLELQVESRSGVPARPMTIALDGTDYVAPSTGRDHVVLDRLLPGSYTIVIRDSALERGGISIPTGVRFMAARDSVVSARVIGRTAREYVYDRCRADGMWGDLDDGDSSAAWVIGRLKDSEGNALEGAVVTVSIAARKSAARARTDAEGIYQICSRALRVGDAAVVSIQHRRLSVAPTDLILRAPITVVAPLTLRR